ncbi:MAG TPA: methylmalonyl Co-A mutase-associated GTPase MeaB, partial [Roseiflexaceae bacterium]
GGIAHATSDTIDLLDAAGFDVILVETVGAGQSEVEIASAAHTTMVIEVPGMGDDVQAIKAGILEIADIFVINKADRDGAEATMRQLRAMLHLGGPPRDGWEPPILPAVAMREEGIPTIAAEVERHLEHLRDTGQKADRERARAAREFQLIVQEAALERARTRLADAGWDALVAQIAAREIDPYAAAAELLD